MDGRTIRKRVQDLQREIAQIREENLCYESRPYHTLNAQALHRDREHRLEQIREELAQLVKIKRGGGPR